MTISAMVLLSLAFIAGTTAVLAAGLLLSDWRRGPEDGQPSTGDNADEPETVSTELLGRSADHWLDRSFYALLDGAGIALSARAALALLAGAAIVGCAAGLAIWESIPAATAGLLLGFSLPLGWWAICRARRLRKMEKMLPTLFDLLADSLRTGCTLEQSVEMAVAQAASPMKEEFGHCLALLKLGNVSATMERMARRIPLPELKVFATAVMVHRQTGGNLAILVHRLARSSRDRQDFHGHLWAQTVSGRYSAIGLVVAVAVGLVVLSGSRPEYLHIFLEHEQGPKILVAAAVLLAVGVVWMGRVLRVKY